LGTSAIRFVSVRNFLRVPLRYLLVLFVAADSLSCLNCARKGGANDDGPAIITVIVTEYFKITAIGWLCLSAPSSSWWKYQMSLLTCAEMCVQCFLQQFRQFCFQFNDGLLDGLALQLL